MAISALLTTTLMGSRGYQRLERLVEAAFECEHEWQSFALQVCKLLPDFCLNFLYQLCGPSQGLDAARLPLYLNYIPAGTSVLNMEHWAQSVRGPADGKLRMMDFGQDCKSPAWPATCNQERYNGAVQPPRYRLETISKPLAILSGRAPHHPLTSNP
jgi:hypothetical protein